MKNTIIYSTITGGSINYSSPTITKADCFATSTATHQGALTYNATRP